MKRAKYRNDQGQLLTYQQIATRYNIGLNTTMKVAKQSGALIRIGNCSRVDPDIFDHYIRENFKVE